MTDSQILHVFRFLYKRRLMAKELKAFLSSPFNLSASAVIYNDLKEMEENFYSYKDILTMCHWVGALYDEIDRRGLTKLAIDETNYKLS